MLIVIYHINSLFMYDIEMKQNAQSSLISYAPHSQHRYEKGRRNLTRQMQNSSSDLVYACPSKVGDGVRFFLSFALEFILSIN